jgi:hypothetical protein
MAEPNTDPLRKFEEFVADILTVTKDEMQKLKDEEQAVKDAMREEALPDDAEPC